MFTQPCFIRKNTPELRKKLEELGYISHIFNNNDTNNIYVDKLGTYISVDIENQPYYIDCGINEELFLALSALRDDTDYMQWFILPKTQIKRMSGCFGQLIGMDGNYQEIIEHEWIQYNMDDRKLSEKIEFELSMYCCDEEKKFIPHKATVEEIIEHFKK